MITGVILTRQVVEFNIFEMAIVREVLSVVRYGQALRQRNSFKIRIRCNCTQLSASFDSNRQMPKVGEYGAAGVVGRRDDSFHETYGLGQVSTSLHQTA